MAGVLPWLAKHRRPSEGGGADALAALILAARDDREFRARLLVLLRLPGAQREPLIRTAVDEMRLRGEPADAQCAFRRLSTDEGARIARELLER
ncbi:MAG TPA: hypothetical protein VHE61_20970 [Opitutaceae bacterium]|nr:hypothetical protein [Opitutaceae bacterium]